MTWPSSWGSFSPDGPVAEAMADLWWLMLALGVVVCAVFGVLLVVGLRRRAPVDDAEATPGHRSFVVWGAVLPSLIILVVFAASTAAMRYVPNTAPDDALVVELVGHQFWWEVRYPGAEVVTANELHLPVGRPVALQLTSADVIHSFWVPELGGKIDALPDGVNTLVLEADQPGDHLSHCAEFCGLQHTNMIVSVTVEPQERFDAWISAQQQPAAEPVDAAAVRGREVFRRASCVDCHAIRGTSTASEPGPDLTHVASRDTIGAMRLPTTADNLASWVSDPHAVKPGVDMPASDLPDEDLQALVAYLEGLR